ncbi:probable anion transporter 4, chloroplastic [Gastrolobium bilobum]|uniref:probable anion transporter 4, chloroplastic n=1 Tax=Gastrolobium bilobum TaxID=150636 RepID=UPI002AAF8DA9|nr:probable anion transporter 4, chloroplastic [Gastrolobium bilobum]
MAWGVALWSLATFLTPWAAKTSILALFSVCALLGMAEGVAFPSMNNMVARWFPQNERAKAVGSLMAGFQLGCAIGLMLSPIFMSQGGIFGPFVIFGLSGFLLVLVWLSATSSTPDGSPKISKYELEYILNRRHKSFSVETVKLKKVKLIPPFRRLLSKLPIPLIVVNSMHSWGLLNVLSWMPIYFNSVNHLDLRHAAWSVMAIMNYLACFWSDMMIQSGTSVSLTRKNMQSIGFVERPCLSPNEQELELKPYSEIDRELNGYLVKVHGLISAGVTDEMFSNHPKVPGNTKLEGDEPKKIVCRLYGYHSDDMTSEVDEYVDALATMDSFEQDRNEDHNDLQAPFLNSESTRTSYASDDNSSLRRDRNEDHTQPQAQFLDSQYIGNSSTSDIKDMPINLVSQTVEWEKTYCGEFVMLDDAQVHKEVQNW